MGAGALWPLRFGSTATEHPPPSSAQAFLAPAMALVALLQRANLPEEFINAVQLPLPPVGNGKIGWTTVSDLANYVKSDVYDETLTTDVTDVLGPPRGQRFVLSRLRSA